MEDYEIIEAYNEMLDETNPEIVIGSLRYSPSYVLREVDPIAYNEGLSDYQDFLEYQESQRIKAACRLDIAAKNSGAPFVLFVCLRRMCL